VEARRDYPLIEVGDYELKPQPGKTSPSRAAAFTTRPTYPGISFSPGQELAGEAVSYGDGSPVRVGVNHNQIAVNYPRAAKLVNTYPPRRGTARRRHRAESAGCEPPKKPTSAVG